MIIVKASGEKAPFNLKKYQTSLARSGLTIAEAKEISDAIYQDLYTGISSSEIYRKTESWLKKNNRVVAAKYSLKRAIMALGPSGFFFERYMAAVLRAYGYQTKVSQFLRGKCVEHEVDIVAERDGKKSMIECKYHNTVGQKSDVKVALYIQSRFLDLKDRYNFSSAVLITNTLCTSEAAQYAKCVGLKIIGWHYPFNGESLEHLIENKKLYPITVLPSLNKDAVRIFSNADLVLVNDLLKFSPELLARKFRLKQNLVGSLFREATSLINS